MLNNIIMYNVKTMYLYEIVKEKTSVKPLIYLIIYRNGQS